MPRDGEPREAGAEDGVAERAGASRQRGRGGGGGGCDGSSGARAEALEEAGPGRKGRWRLRAVRRRHGFSAPVVDEDAAATVPDRRTAGSGVAALFSAGIGPTGKRHSPFRAWRNWAAQRCLESKTQKSSH